MNEKELDELEAGDKVLWKETGIVAEVIHDGVGERLNFSSDDIREEDVPGVIEPQELRKMPICDEGHESLVFSEKEGEWMCPVCHL